MEFHDVELEHVTEKAMLIKFPGGGEPKWIPRSQIESTDLENKGDRGSVVLTEWIAKREGLL